MTDRVLEHSRALWNRERLDLRSDETLAQLLDRGEMSAWRELYRLARADHDLRQRILHIIRSVPLPFSHFWLAALKSLGEDVDVGEKTPEYPGDVA